MGLACISVGRVMESRWVVILARAPGQGTLPYVGLHASWSCRPELILTYHLYIYFLTFVILMSLNRPSFFGV